MDKYNEDRISMVDTVITTMDAHTDETADIPAIAITLTAIRQKRAVIEEFRHEQDTARTGLSSAKTAAREDLCNATLALASGGEAYAHSIESPALVDTFHLYYTDLYKLRDTLLVGKTNDVITAATPLVPAAEPYGITAASIAAVEEKKNAFSDLIGESGHGRAEGKSAGIDLEEEIRGIIQLFTGSLDKLMNNYRISNPTLFRTYKEARNIINTGQPSNKNKPPAPASVTWLAGVLAWLAGMVGDVFHIVLTFNGTDWQAPAESPTSSNSLPIEIGSGSVQFKVRTKRAGVFGPYSETVTADYGPFVTSEELGAEVDPVAGTVTVTGGATPYTTAVEFYEAVKPTGTPPVPGDYVLVATEATPLYVRTSLPEAGNTIFYYIVAKRGALAAEPSPTVSVDIV